MARTFQALSIDAAGTLLRPHRPVEHTYVEIGRRFGVTAEPREVGTRMRAAMTRHRAGREQSAHWRPFWRLVVADATGSSDPGLFEALYTHFARPAAWRIAAGAQACCRFARQAGVPLALISNWDLRLRPILEGLDVAPWFDAIVISGEVGVEKPDPRIFALACERLEVEPSAALHVGDSRRADVEGARAAGLQALHFGHDVSGFAELRDRLAAP